MNGTPRSERLHIGVFGKRNAGKSSLLNAITGQKTAVVSDVKGTTTDPVYKAMELLPIGPVVLIDTAGTDDIGEVGELRLEKTRSVLRKTDFALLVANAEEGLSPEDIRLISRFEEMGILYLIVYNKYDISTAAPREDGISVSAKTGMGIEALKEKIAAINAAGENPPLVSDLINAGDTVILVIPIDESAPRGRLILPQQQVIRDILDSGAIAIATRETEFSQTLIKLAAPPKLIITDSQAFKRVEEETPKNVRLTSFSILLSRYKGALETAIIGAAALDEIRDDDIILISEACTHHRQCDDIATKKLPRLINEYTKAAPKYEFTSGGDFPSDLRKYKLAIHCGACMINRREMQFRQKSAVDANVPITNFGVAIAFVLGILERCKL